MKKFIEVSFNLRSIPCATKGHFNGGFFLFGKLHNLSIQSNFTKSRSQTRNMYVTIGRRSLVWWLMLFFLFSYSQSIVILLSKFYNCLFSRKGDNRRENFQFLETITLQTWKGLWICTDLQLLWPLMRNFEKAASDWRNDEVELCWFLQLHTDQLTVRNSPIPEVQNNGNE